MKWLQDFKMFELMMQDFHRKKPSAHQNAAAPRIADNKMFQELVKKYNLQIITTSLQDKRGVVRFKLPHKYYNIGYENRIYAAKNRTYTMYPTGVIRGDSEKASFHNDPNPSQYVLFRLYPNNLYRNNRLIETNDEINKMVEKLDKTLQYQERKYQRIVDECKRRLENDPSFALKCPPEILATLKHKLAGVANLGIFEEN